MALSRDDVIAMLRQIEKLLNNRIVIVREIVDPDGTVTGRVSTGHFHATPSRREPPSLADLG